MSRLPGVQDNVLPAELLVRPTEVIEHGAPETMVFEPNALGTQGNSVIPQEDLWRAGLDGYRRLGNGNPAATAAAASQGLAERLANDINAEQQVPRTMILKYEGGSKVVYHEPTRDDQVSTLAHGLKVSGDPAERLQQILAHKHTQTAQRPPVSVRQSHRLADKLSQGMTEQSKASFMQLLAQSAPEVQESLSHEPLPGTATDMEVATESGVPLSVARQNPELLELMRQKATQQRFNASRPMARFHPGQSNYESPDGQYNRPRGWNQRGQMGFVRTPFFSPPEYEVKELQDHTVVQAPGEGSDVGLGNGATTQGMPVFTLPAVLNPGVATTYDASPSTGLVNANTTLPGYQKDSTTDTGTGVTHVDYGMAPRPNLPGGGSKEEETDAWWPDDGPPAPGSGSEDTCSYVDATGLVHYMPCEQMLGDRMQPTYKEGSAKTWLIAGGIMVGMIGLAVVVSKGAKN